MSLRKNTFPYDAEILPEIPKKTQQNTPTTKETETDVCSICFESSEKIMYINCKKGCIQENNSGRGSSGYKDKPICKNCLERCKNCCPYCRKKGKKNCLLNINIKTTRFPKKKEPWKIRELNRIINLAIKEHKKKKEKAEKERLEKIRANSIGGYYGSQSNIWHRRYTQPGRVRSYRVDEIGREENIFGNFYSNFDYASIM